jgi:hypothetical protein
VHSTLPVRLKDGDLELVFDTAAEAAEYRAQITRQSQPEKPKRGRRTAEPRPAANGGTGWEAFVAGLAARSDERAVRMKKMLALIKGRGVAGIEWTELAKAMLIKDVQQVYGTFSGLTKALKGAGLKPDHVIIAGKDKKVRPGRLLLENEPPTP